MDLNETVRAKLEEIDPLVFYGQAGSVREGEMWDYTVFYRRTRDPSANRTGKTYYFNVAIVRENEIPDGLDNEVIEKVLEIPGVRVAGNATYAYTKKQNTGVVVEVLDIPFLKAVKG